LEVWIRAARSGAAEIDRQEVCDVTVGELLANAPSEKDDSWPCNTVRKIFEEIDSPRLLNGFVIGIKNKRRSYTKLLGEGGRQERDLATKYEGYAKQSRARWPRISAALSQVAAEYREEARREDLEAEIER
jgi:hypothetical protein